MYCKCGNRIEGVFKYPDYCRECNKVIRETLEDLLNKGN